MRLTFSGPLLCSAVLCAGCAAGPGGRAADPHRALKAYAQAIDSSKYDTAYGMMTADFRKRHNQQEFVRMLRDNPDALKQAVSQLKGPVDRVELQAELSYAEGDKLRLVVEQGQWKIASDPVDFYSQRTPAEALRSFVRAIERRRYDIVLRFVPAKWAGKMTVDTMRKQWEGEKQGEVKQLLGNLKANLKAQIHTSGDRANMPYGEKHEVRFVREDSLWKIEDPD
jgi:hypothetical protein